MSQIAVDVCDIFAKMDCDIGVIGSSIHNRILNCQQTQITVMLRSFTRSVSTRYKFYDLVLETPTRPREPIEASLMKAKDLRKLQATTKNAYEGKYTLEGSAAERIEKIFGGRIRGDQRTSSSRLTRGKPRIIAGVQVPDRPPEPDNCCMSGCINCVWELYRDDIKEWNDKRREAALKVNESGSDFVWPHDFYPPVKYLDQKHIPEGVEKEKVSEKQHKDDAWGNVPVAIRVFAEAEKKIKARKKQSTEDRRSRGEEVVTP